MSRLLLTLVLVLKLVTDCEAQLRPTGPPDGTKEEKRIQWIVVIGEGAERGRREAVLREVGRLVTESPEGTCVHVIRAPDHKPLGSLMLKVPTKNRLRDSAVSDFLNKVRELLADEGPVPPDYREQINFPRLWATILSVKKKTPHAIRMVLFGTPVYHDPKEPQWSFREGRYPNRASLEDVESTLGAIDVEGKRQVSCDITWLVPPGLWGQDIHHEKALIDFYRRAFRVWGGRLKLLTSDPGVAFAPQPHDQAFIELQDDGVRQDEKPGLTRFERLRPVPAPVEAAASQTSQTGDTAIQTEIQAALNDEKKSLIAIGWNGTRNTDIDLWLTSKGLPGEICFAQMYAPWGHLVRDVRVPGDFTEEARFESWELAKIEHSRLEDLGVWLNAFEGTGPVDLKLIVVHLGKKYTKTLRFEFQTADRASGRNRRSLSQAWMQIDLPSLLR